MYCVGLTGPIASGKSLACSLFSSFEIPVISADEINRKLIAPPNTAYHAIVKHFGETILLPNQALNKPKLRQIISEQPAEHHWLEAYLHPLIQEEIQIACEQLPTSSSYCIIEIPLLSDRKPYPYLNRVLLIQSDQSSQLKRLMQRDKLSETEARAMISIQPSMSTYKQIADDIITNDTGEADFLKKIKKLHQQYLQLSRQKS